MADALTGQIYASLGFATITVDSFSIAVGKPIGVVLLSLIPDIIGTFEFELFAWEGVLEPKYLALGIFALAFLIAFATYAISAALLVQLTLDAKCGRPLRIGRYVPRALASTIPVTILGLLVGAMVVLATIALVIPGIWVVTVFSVVIPAVVIERTGFRSLTRSETLTRNYRWPILGTLLAVGICSTPIVLVAQVLDSSFSGWTGMAIVSLLGSLAYAPGTIATALIYARLREIKERISLDQIARDFA